MDPSLHALQTNSFKDDDRKISLRKEPSEDSQDVELNSGEHVPFIYWDLLGLFAERDGTLQGQVYQRIMEDVIENCQTTFEEDGVSQQTLEDLRQVSSFFLIRPLISLCLYILLAIISRCVSIA